MTRTLGIALIGQQFMGRAHSNAWGQVAKFFELPVEPRQVTIVARDRPPSGHLPCAGDGSGTPPTGESSPTTPRSNW